MTPTPGTDSRPQLIRAIGRWDLIGILINATIGAGILGLPGRAYALLGNASLVALIIDGALIGLVGASFAQAGSRFARSGGAYLYSHAAFGPFVGFVAGWIGLLTRLLSYATICNLAIGYAAGLWPSIATGPWRLLTITALTGGLTALVYAGVRLSTVANNVFTVGKLALLLGFVAIGLPTLFANHLPATPPPPAANWASGMTVLLYGLIGLDATVINAGEMRAPRRDLPFAMAAGIATVVALYMLVILVSIATVPDLAHATRPLAEGMTRLLGPAGGWIFTFGAIGTMTGTMFVIVFMGPRQILALAENAQLPAWVGRIHPRFHTPHRAVLATGLIAWTLSVANSFLSALTAATLTRLLLYAATALAAVVLQERGFSETPAPLVLPCGKAIGWAAFVGCVLVMSQASHADLLGLTFAVLPALALATLLVRRRRP